MAAMLERRFLPGAEVRMVGGDRKVFHGRAVEYDAWSELLYGVFRERIAPGAFDESLARQGCDVYASVDHDPKRMLGRQSSGTLRLLPDARGIAVEVDRADYSYAQDLALALERRDIRGMSFIFDVRDDKWESRDGVPHRTVLKADIFEVSFVAFPAYAQTDAGVRGIPLAIPVAGEERAVARAREILAAPLTALRRMRLDLAERC